MLVLADPLKFLAGLEVATFVDYSLSIKVGSRVFSLLPIAISVQLQYLIIWPILSTASFHE